MGSGMNRHLPGGGLAAFLVELDKGDENHQLAAAKIRNQATTLREKFAAVERLGREVEAAERRERDVARELDRARAEIVKLRSEGRG